MLNATITKRIEVTKELVRLTLKPDAPFKPFLSGQYVAIGLMGSAPRPAEFGDEVQPQEPTKLIKRAYSIGSSPSVTDELEFYIAILPQGALTARLALVKEGDRIYVAPKITGTFTLEGLPAEANLVLVSTGTGIAPFISMLRTESTWVPGRKFTILHGVRYPKDLGYRDELLALQEKHGERFVYHPVVSRDDGSNWNGLKGHVQKLFTDKVVPLDPKVDHVFLCGNPAMINDVEVMLSSQGYTEHTRKAAGNLHLERYW